MSAVAVPAPAVKVTTRSPRDQILLVAMVVAVVAFAFYLLAWKLQSAALSQARDERAGTEAQLAAASPSAAAEAAGNDPAAARAEEAAESQVLTGVPADIATAELLRQIDGLAAQSGVRLGDITLSQPAPLVADPSAAVPTDSASVVVSSGPVSLSLTLNVSGDPAASAVFVAGLATLPRLVVVDQVTIQTTPADATAGTPARHEVQVAARVFATGG